MKLPISTPKPKEVATLFINKQEAIDLPSERFNIVLSPVYYWFKSEALPVKSVAQAKKLAPSLFDGMVPEGEYSYHAIKQGEQFWLFAYNDALIVAKLTQLGIKPSQINKIFFAQTECFELDVALDINDGFALIAQEGVVSLVVSQYVQSNTSIAHYFSKRPLSKHAISLSFFQNSFIDEKYIYRLIGVAVAVILVYFGNYLILRKDLQHEKGREVAIIDKYKLPQTSFELEGLKHALYSKEKRQLELRSNIKKLLDVSLQKGEYVKKLDITQKTARYEIVMSGSKRAEAIKADVQKHFKISSPKVIDNTFYVSVAL